DVPADEPLYVHAGNREAQVRLAAGHDLRFEKLAMATPHTAARGAIGDALERGLFVSGFGPHYYLGWIDHQEQRDAMQPVPLAAQRPADNLDHHSRSAGIALVTSASLLAAGGIVFAGLAAQARSDYDAARYERASTDASHRFTGFLTGAL